MLVVWELPLASLALASGSRRRIRKGGGQVWCVCGYGCGVQGTQSRAVVLTAWRQLMESGELLMAMEGAWSKRRWARCAGCRMRIILSGCPFGGLGGQGKAGRRHFALIVFAPHLQFWNGFLTWPVFADTIILARFGNDKTRRIAEGPVSGKGRTECRNAGTVNHGTKRSVCCGRVLGPFNVPMAVDGRGFHFPAVSTAWQQQW